MTTLTIERPVQTCATCPLFNPEQGVHGWCGAFDRMAKPHHERTATCDQEIAAQEEAAAQPQATQAVDVYEQGVAHGQRDAQERLHPIYEKNLHEYARGYVQGYQSILNPKQQSTEGRYQQGFAHGEADAKARLFPGYDRVSCQYTEGYLAGYKSLTSPPQPAEWAVVLDNRWGVYQAWVGDRCIGPAPTEEEAERKARSYIATDELIRRQNAAVLAAYMV